MDFRRKKSSPLSPLLVDGRTVEILKNFKLYGSVISNNLKWKKNTDIIVKKAQQRLYFLRRLRSFGLTRQIMLIFYSVLTISNTIWFGSITVKKAQIEQNCKNCFQINWQIPPQSWIFVSATPVRKSHSHLLWFIPSCPWPIWSPSIFHQSNQDQQV